MSFGIGASHRFIPIHEIVFQLDSQVSSNLVAFHAFTGCDTTSGFCGRGKKTAWATWSVFPEVSNAFNELSMLPNVMSDESMAYIERFVVLLYDRTSEDSSVNEARKKLFAQKARTLENIPPTRSSLVEHVRRAALQANTWKSSLQRNFQRPNPASWGWTKDGDVWMPFWSSNKEAALSCSELIHCGCKKECTKGRCKCKKAALQCTALCNCAGGC